MTRLRRAVLVRTFWTAVTLAVAPTHGYAQPTWTQIFQSGQSADYDAYSGSTAIEQSGTSTTRPPHTYGASYTVTPTVTRGKCPYSNRSGLYWYSNGSPLGSSGTGTANPPIYPYPPASEFTETTWGSPNTNVKGVEGDLDFSSGRASGGTTFYEVLYFTDEYCTDGSNEYGYAYNVVTGSLQFYWGTLENCTIGGVTYCFQNANGTGAEPQQQDKVDISRLGTNGHNTHEWLYEAWISTDASAVYGYSLTFAVVDPFTGSYAQCSLNGGALGSCTWSGLASQATWFRADLLYNSSGWVVVGTQMSGNPLVTSGFSATGVYVGQ
ncbi:MAG TPA: hypothetical protein VEU62_11430 [Bryobacterales bacterium]|nr:hypothetical protein [Bryobacterales bacterium]